MLSYSSLEGGNVSYPLLYDRSPQNFVTESNKSFYLLSFSGQLGCLPILSQLCSSLQAVGSSSEVGWSGIISLACLSAGRSDSLEPFSQDGSFLSTWSLIFQQGFPPGLLHMVVESFPHARECKFQGTSRFKVSAHFDVC